MKTLMIGLFALASNSVFAGPTLYLNNGESTLIQPIYNQPVFVSCGNTPAVACSCLWTPGEKGEKRGYNLWYKDPSRNIEVALKYYGNNGQETYAMCLHDLSENPSLCRL